MSLCPEHDKTMDTTRINTWPAALRHNPTEPEFYRTMGTDVPAETARRMGYNYRYARRYMPPTIARVAVIHAMQAGIEAGRIMSQVAQGEQP